MRVNILFFLVIISYSSCSSNSRFRQQIEQILDSYKLNNPYIRPNYGDKPVIVNVSINVNDIGSIDEIEMNYELDIYLRQCWMDDRLSFNQSINEIVVGSNFLNKIWIPDTFFVNGRKTEQHFSTNRNTNALIRIRSTGQVLFSTRMTITGRCPMNLIYFPMDSQTCQLMISSYGYTVDDIVYIWNNTNLDDQFSNMNLPNFRITKHKLIHKNRKFITGQFSTLILEVVLTRSLGFYINQVYIPAILIVIISWIPFWLDREDTHARVALGVTTVLTMTTLVTQTNEAMPKISYLKALDIYLVFCFAMVFLSLIQYAIVCYYTIRIGKYTTENDHATHSLSNLHDKARIIIFKRNPSKLDWHSRHIFPLVFVLFNFIYWVTYITLSKIIS